MKSILYLILIILSDINAKDSSYKCLLLVCEIAKDDVLANFMPFISNTINSVENNTR